MRSLNPHIAHIYGLEEGPTEAGRHMRASPPALIVVQHWDEELKRLVPTTR